MCDCRQFVWAPSVFVAITVCDCHQFVWAPSVFVAITVLTRDRSIPGFEVRVCDCLFVCFIFLSVLIRLLIH